RPATTPRNSAGNVGPPRKLPSEMLQASPLNTSRSASVESEIVAAELKSAPKASSPENSTEFAGSPVDSLKAIASPPTASPAAIVSRNWCVSTTRLSRRPTSIPANVTPTVATARRGEGGGARRAECARAGPAEGRERERAELPCGRAESRPASEADEDE